MCVLYLNVYVVWHYHCYLNTENREPVHPFKFAALRAGMRPAREHAHGSRKLDVQRWPPDCVEEKQNGEM